MNATQLSAACLTCTRNDMLDNGDECSEFASNIGQVYDTYYSGAHRYSDYKKKKKLFQREKIRQTPPSPHTHTHSHTHKHTHRARAHTRTERLWSVHSIFIPLFELAPTEIWFKSNIFETVNTFKSVVYAKINILWHILLQSKPKFRKYPLHHPHRPTPTRSFAVLQLED